MKRPYRLALAVLALGATTPPLVALPAYLGGRAIREADGTLEIGWPGAYLEAHFRGTAFRVAFQTNTDHLRLMVDGEEKRRFESPGPVRVEAVVDGLPEGEHVVRLEKLTESQSGGTHFLGFFLPAGGTPLPPRPSPRQIEFVGDSYTVGYGNTSPTKSCTPAQVHDTTDSQRAFGPLLAHQYDADYRVNAYSGFGVVRNYDGGSPALSLPAIYPRLKPDDPAHLDRGDPAWHPQLIVVNLGTNDFSTPLHPGERWRTPERLRAAYRQRYVAFVGELHARQPQARFVLMGSPLFWKEVTRVAAVVNAQAPGLTTPVRFDGLAYAGCDSHPSAGDDRLLEALLARTVDGLGLGWPSAAPAPSAPSPVGPR